MKVLLIEDHKALADLTVRMLRQMYDHDVQHAATGAAALECASRNEFDLILVDLNLPDVSGYEVATRLRKMDHLAKTILVALTGMGELINREAVKESGFDASYSKPMDFKMLETLKRRE